MSYKMTQNVDGTWALVNSVTGNTVLSIDADDAISFVNAGLIGFSRGALAATGSGASTAAVITEQVTAVTASDGTKAVALPAAATTTGPLLVVNTVTTATLPVYPVNGGNDNINAGAEDAAFTLGAGKSAWFIPTSATQWYVEDASAVTSTTTEMNYVDVATLGTLAASKAWTSDASLDTIMPTGGKLTVQSGGDITLESGSTLDVAGTFEIANVAMTASAAELNYNDIATLGTLAASKTWTSDASLDTVMPTGGLLTVQSGGAVTLNSGSTLTVSGAVVQAPVFVADATPYTVLAADSGKLHIILEQTSSITLNLPVIAAGLSYKFVMGGVATEAQNWVIVATTPSFYNGGIAWTDLNDAESNLAVVYANGTSHLTLTVTTPAAGTGIEIYSNGTEWFVHGTVISDSTPAFT
jgi:hypothetical protein